MRSPARSASSDRAPVLVIVGVAASAGIHLATQFSMLLVHGGWSDAFFRSYYSSDQLAYFAIVVNGAEGQVAAVEPFTETGTINYPRAYYLLLGAVAHATGWTPALAWTVCGLLIQVLLVIGVSLACVVATRRAWTAFLGAAPFVVGTFAWAMNGSWLTTMDSHAVLWGPFGTLFTLNGEAAALCLAGLALVTLTVATGRGLSTRRWLLIGTAAAVVIGGLANVQTYSFLTAVYLVGYGVAAHAIAMRPRVWSLAATGVLAIGLFVVGPSLSGVLGQLPMLALGLTPALPGLVLALLRTRGMLAIPGLGAVVAASPQILGTWFALRAGDPFLNYRVASSKDLGVSLPEGVIAAIVLLAALGVILWRGVRTQDRWLLAFPPAVLAAWIVVASNDLWGANQEPYRFWLDTFLLGLVCALPLLLRATVGAPATDVATSAPVPASRAPVVAFALVVVLAITSSFDWVGWFRIQAATVPIDLASPQLTALATVAEEVDDDGLLVSEPCITPLMLKAVTGLPVAFYNLGMAWPTDRAAIDTVLVERETELPSTRELEAADIRWVITDDACESSWDLDDRDDLALVATASYDGAPGGTVQLWVLGSAG